MEPLARERCPLDVRVRCHLLTRSDRAHRCWWSWLWRGSRWKPPKIEHTGGLVPARRRDAGRLELRIRIVEECSTGIARVQDDDSIGLRKGPPGQRFKLGVLHSGIIPRRPTVVWASSGASGPALGLDQLVQRQRVVQSAAVPEAPGCTVLIRGKALQ